MENSQLLLQAFHFAAEKHRDHRRKDVHASPYINHPILVAQILAGVGVEDPEILAGAILHDVLEDTDTSLGELAMAFGDRVARIVSAVTDDKSLPKVDRKRLQIEHAPELSEEAALVKIADKISNVSDVTHNPPPDWDNLRRTKYLDWAEEVVNKCPKVNGRLLAQFAQTISLGKAALVDQ